jgi:DnaJ-class molecular chaperone
MHEDAVMNYTYYDYLELAPGSSAARIEAAYAQILERFGYGTTDAGQDLSGLVRQIHAAYEVLSNPDKRSHYDSELDCAARAADRELKETLDRKASLRARLAQDVPDTLRSTWRSIAA